MPGPILPRPRLLSFGAAMVLLASPVADANATEAQRGVTSTGYETLRLDGDIAGDPHWCGNDALVYVRTTIRESMFTSGDLMHADVVTGEVRTLTANIFKFYDEAFTDWPDDYEGDSAGDFFTWPLGCSHDGQWLFYRHEEYEGRISKDARRPEIRAWNLLTDEQLVVTSTPFDRKNWIAPDGQRLLIPGLDWSGGARQTPMSLPWELAEYPSGAVLGWLDDSQSVMLTRRDASGRQVWGFHDLATPEGTFQQVMLPADVQSLLPNTPGYWLRFRHFRHGRLVGDYMALTADRQSATETFYACDVEGLTFRCRKSPPLTVARHFFVWSRDGSSVFYERFAGSTYRSRQIVRHDIATGQEEIIVAADHALGNYLRGEISPEGDRLLIGRGNLNVIFLHPSLE